MSSFKAIFKDTAVTSFSALLKPVPEQEVLSKMARTDQEIESIKDAAFAAGFKDGRSAGHSEGLPKGYEDGFVNGTAEGLRLVEAELAALHTELTRTVRKIEHSINEWYEKTEPGLAQLAVLIAKRVVAKELATSPETILAITKEAVAEVTHATSARIRVHVFDSEILEAHRSEILAAAASIRNLEIVEDPEIAGGCVVETDGGIVDATVDMKFEEILDRVRSAA